MIKKEKKEPPPNLKEQNALCAFRITIRDRVHFYKIVNWLISNVGRGSDKWTMEGNILRRLVSGPVSPMIYIFKPDFDQESAVFLSLL